MVRHCLPPRDIIRKQMGNAECRSYIKHYSYLFEKFFQHQLITTTARSSNFNWSMQGADFLKKVSLAGIASNLSMRPWPDSDHQPALLWGSFATCRRRESVEYTHFLLYHICSGKGCSNVWNLCRS